MTQTDPNANPNPNPAPAADPNPNPAPTSDDVKPLTEAEIASMSTEEITAHAEKLEEQVKNRKQQTPDQIRENQVRRLQKVQERAFDKNDTNTTPEAKKEIAQADLLTLGKTDFELGSKEQQILQWYVENGKVASYKEAMNHPAVKAELAALEAEGNAAAVIDENDPDDVKLRTKKEAIANARATGEVPEDPEIRKALVEDNLSRMSALK